MQEQGRQSRALKIYVFARQKDANQSEPDIFKNSNKIVRKGWLWGKSLNSILYNANH